MWVARDKDGFLVGFNHKPIRMDYNESGYYGWTTDPSQVPSPKTDSINFQIQISRIILPSTLFPDLKWEDEPIEVSLVSNSINEDELDKLANDYCPDSRTWATINGFEERVAFKAGYRAAFNKQCK